MLTQRTRGREVERSREREREKRAICILAFVCGHLFPHFPLQMLFNATTSELLLVPFQKRVSVQPPGYRDQLPGAPRGPAVPGFPAVPHAARLHWQRRLPQVPRAFMAVAQAQRGREREVEREVERGQERGRERERGLVDTHAHTHAYTCAHTLSMPTPTPSCCLCSGRTSLSGRWWLNTGRGAGRAV